MLADGNIALVRVAQGLLAYAWNYFPGKAIEAWDINDAQLESKMHEIGSRANQPNRYSAVLCFEQTFLLTKYFHHTPPPHF